MFICRFIQLSFTITFIYLEYKGTLKVFTFNLIFETELTKQSEKVVCFYRFTFA